MKSPFPGMDPYLEGYLWPDVHHRIASVIAELIAPQISPKYVARIELYNVSDTHPSEDVGILYPDVEVLKRKTDKIVKEPAVSYGNTSPFTPVTVEVPIHIDVKIPVVEIIDRDKNQLITAIEVLSPVNKRKPGLVPYQQKRQRLFESGIHLLEIDLIRRGERPFADFCAPSTHYMVALTRAYATKSSVWAMTIRDALPIVPVPLKGADADAVLDMGKALDIIYERSLYHLSIDYQKIPPPPVFTSEELTWMKKL